MTKRAVSLPDDAADAMEQFIEEVDKRLASDEDTCEIVEEILVDLHGDREAYERWQSGADVSPAERVRLQGYDPCNTTVESEYYAEVDGQSEQFEESKHLQWLWRQFDATPMADNVEFALQFRRMLADHLFEECGDNCRFFKGISMTYGHNISIGDNVVVHDGVHLDDRGALTIGGRVSISDDTHIYSHDHDVVDQTEVTNYHTIIEDDVRLTYDSMVRAGVKIGRNALVAAKSVAEADVPAHHIVAGSPAESVAVKSGWESVAEPAGTELADNRSQRQVTYEIPDDVDLFDEFKRDLSPPDP